MVITHTIARLTGTTSLNISMAEFSSAPAHGSTAFAAAQSLAAIGTDMREISANSVSPDGMITVDSGAEMTVDSGAETISEADVISEAATLAAGISAAEP